MVDDASKHLFVRLTAEEGDYDVLVETGIRDGVGATTAWADLFTTYAVDINPENVEAAKACGVDAVCGDSGLVLPKLLARIDRPACFWLDAHMVVEENGESSCPLVAELDAILAWPYAAKSTVLIDNLDCFGREGWPTVEEIREKVDPVWRRRERVALNDIMELFPIGVSDHQ